MTSFNLVVVFNAVYTEANLVVVFRPTQFIQRPTRFFGFGPACGGGGLGSKALGPPHIAPGCPRPGLDRCGHYQTRLGDRSCVAKGDRSGFVCGTPGLWLGPKVSPTLPGPQKKQLLSSCRAFDSKPFRLRLDRPEQGELSRHAVAEPLVVELQVQQHQVGGPLHLQLSWASNKSTSAAFCFVLERRSEAANVLFILRPLLGV